MVRDFLDLLLSEIFLGFFDFLLLDSSLSSNDISDLGGVVVTLVSTGSSNLRYFFSISLVALSISSSIFLISLYRL